MRQSCVVVVMACWLGVAVGLVASSAARAIGKKHCLTRAASAYEPEPVLVEASDDGWRSDWACTELRWYILQCYTGQEAWCASQIEEALSTRPVLRAKLADVVVPYENVASTRGRKVMHKARIVFPGYIFCRMHMEHELWSLLTQVPKVVNFIGEDPGVRNGLGEPKPGLRGKVRPVALESDEAERMLSMVRRSQEEASNDIVGVFELGDRVAITNGKHAGEQGLVRNVRNNRLIVRLVGVGTAAFDIEIEPVSVRKLSQEEITQQEASEKPRKYSSVEDAPYGAASQDAQLRARRERKASRRRREDNIVKESAPTTSRASRWEAMAAASNREVNNDLSFLDDLFRDLDGELNKDEDGDDFLGALLGDKRTLADGAKVDSKSLLSGHHALDDELLMPITDDDGDGDSRHTPSDEDLLAQLLCEGDEETDHEGKGNDFLLGQLLGEDEHSTPPSKRDSTLDEDDALLRGFLSGDEGDLLAGLDSDDELLRLLGMYDDDEHKGNDTSLLDEVPSIQEDFSSSKLEPTPRTQATTMFDYASLTVHELKAQLKARGLKVSGRKAELIARLQSADDLR